MRLAKRVGRISESLTLKLNALVQQMKKEGAPVINLTAGEPDFSVPELANEAIRKALSENRSKYTPVPGIPELREAVAEKTNAQQPDLKTPWKSENVVVSNGGKQSLFNAFMAILDPGEEVLIPSPFWLTYPESVKIADGKPQIVKTTFENGFKLTPQDLKDALSTKTRIVILNSPSNPTGAMYSKQELQALGEVLADFPDTWIVSDEIYDRIAYGDPPFCSFLGACPQLQARTITSNGMSKSAAMTGWRIGWTVAPVEITKAIVRLQGQATSGINALAQWASVAALKIPEGEFSSQVQAFKKRRDLTLETLQKSGKIRVRAPEGAFYAFLGVGSCLKNGEDSVGFAERLLQDAKVAVVPGTPFGEPNFVRVSFATDEKTLQEGVERLVQFVEKPPG